MGVALILLGLLAGFIGMMEYIAAGTVMQQIVGMLWGTSGTVLFGTGCVCLGLANVHKALTPKVDP